MRRKTNTTTATANKQAVRSHGVIVVFLVLVGLLASVVVYFKTRHDGVAMNAQHQVAVSEEQPARGTPRQPKYDFYTDLPQRQVMIPPPEPRPLRNVAPPPERTPTQTPQQAAPQPPPRTPERPPTQAAPQPPPRAPERPPTPAVQPPPQAAVATETRYIVQAGAFSLYSQADRVRAQLSLLGIQARIEEGNREGLPVYRVRVGPLSERDADAISRRLSDNNIAALKMRAH